MDWEKLVYFIAGLAIALLSIVYKSLVERISKQDKNVEEVKMNYLDRFKGMNVKIDRLDSSLKLTRELVIGKLAHIEATAAKVSKENIQHRDS